MRRNMPEPVPELVAMIRLQRELKPYPTSPMPFTTPSPACTPAPAHDKTIERTSPSGPPKNISLP